MTAVAPEATLAPARAALSPLHATLTAEEVGQVRLACDVAAQAFAEGLAALRPGLREPEVAVTFARPLTVAGLTARRCCTCWGFYVLHVRSSLGAGRRQLCAHRGA